MSIPVTRSQTRAARVRARSAKVAFALLASFALGALLVNPIAGFLLALTLSVLVWLDWRVPRGALAGLYMAAVLLVPGDYRLAIGSPVDLTAERMVLAGLLVLWLLGFVRDERPWPQTAMVVSAPLLAILLWAFVSLVANAGQLSAASADMLLMGLKRYATLIGFLLSVSVIFWLVRTRAEVRRFLGTSVALGVVAAGVAIIEHFAKVNLAKTLMSALPFQLNASDSVMVRGDAARVYGTASHPIEFGGIMSMLLPVALYLALTAESRRERVSFWSASAFLAMGMLFAVSRSSVLAVMAGLALLFVLAPARRRPTIAGIVLVGLFAVHMVLPGLLGTFRYMMTPSKVYQMEVADDNGRLSDYPAVWSTFGKRPLFGMGYGTWDPRLYFHLDNQFLMMLLTLGLPGVVLLAWLFFSLGVRLWRAARARSSLDDALPLEAALLAAVVGFAVLSALFDTLSFFQVTDVFLIIAACAAVALAPQQENSWEGATTCPTPA